jgi:hypothetical protein
MDKRETTSCQLAQWVILVALIMLRCIGTQSLYAGLLHPSEPDSASIRVKEDFECSFAVSNDKSKLAIVLLNCGQRMRPAEGRKKKISNGESSLWIIEIQTQRVIQIASFGTSNITIDHLLWSTGDSWISFETDDTGGHSPLTTHKAWVAKSDGKSTQQIPLPEPYNRFSTQVVNWKNDRTVLTKGFQYYQENSGWKEDTRNFLFDCSTGTIEESYTR